MGRFKTMMPTTQSSQSGKSSVGNPPAAPKLRAAQPEQAALAGLEAFKLPKAAGAAEESVTSRPVATNQSAPN